MAKINFPRPLKKVTKAEAKQAVATLIHYIGEDVTRGSLPETPERVIKSFEELYGGYSVDIADLLTKRFEEVEGFDDIVVLRHIEFQSMCEHHMLPFYGTADVAYLPGKAVVGLSKLARLVDAYAKRMQIQEKLTAQIAKALQEHIEPRGVAVRIIAQHNCMMHRGAKKSSAEMETSYFTGEFKANFHLQQRFLNYK